MAQTVPNNPVPLAASLLQLKPGTTQVAPGNVISKEWAQWLQQTIVTPVSTSAQLVKTVSLTAQGAAIATTPIPLPSLATGSFRLTYYARITTVATINSSLTVTFSWTESGVSLSRTMTAIVGNLTTTTLSESTMIVSDAASAISYATAYVSNAAGMKYRLTILLESVS